MKQITLDLSTARAAAPVDLGSMKVVYGCTVRRLSGNDAGNVKLHFGDANAPGLEVDEGEARDGLAVTSIRVTNPGGGGTLQLELHGA